MKIGNIEFGKYPLFLAPMEDVTDPAFRLACKNFGADMVYSEFISADALIRSVERTEKTDHKRSRTTCCNTTIWKRTRTNCRSCSKSRRSRV